MGSTRSDSNDFNSCASATRSKNDFPVPRLPSRITGVADFNRSTMRLSRDVSTYRSRMSSVLMSSVLMMNSRILSSRHPTDFNADLLNMTDAVKKHCLKLVSERLLQG